MSTATPSALRPRPFRPTWEVGASLGIHALLAATLIVTEYVSRPEEPLVDMSKVMMVQAVALPKQTTRLPDKPMRTPDPPKSQPTPEPVPTAPPPPPTASDMVLHKDDAPKPPESEPSKDRTDDRAALLNQMKREQLLRDASAPIGPEDKVQTSPDGVDPADAIMGSGIGTPMDPELARYISACRSAILPNWTPMPATVAANPGYQVHLLVEVRADGSIGEPKVVKGTGDPTFDRTALTAVLKTGRLPPPPAKYAASAAKGVYITLAARDL